MATTRDLQDRARSVVYLESAPRGAFEQSEPGHAVMDQRDETFVPHLLAITTGTTVDFPNSDRIYHNVFSLSKTDRFDLGRYAQGAYGLAWVDLRRSGFSERWDETTTGALHTSVGFEDPFDHASADAALEASWTAFADLEPETLGRRIWEMYDSRGFALPGNAKGASAFIARDFVTPGDYGAALRASLRPSPRGRADPDPKGRLDRDDGGAVRDRLRHEQGFFQIDVRERKLQGTGMGPRCRRGSLAAAVAEAFAPISSRWTSRRGRHVDDLLHIPPKSPDAIAAGSVGLSDPAGMSEHQREALVRRRGG